MVGRKNRDNRVGRGLQAFQGTDNYSRRCVSRHRLKNNFRAYSHLLHLIGHHKPLVVVADHNLGFSQPGNALHGFLQHGVLTVKAMELLGVMMSGFWPQTAATAARENYGYNRGHKNLASS